MRDPMTEWNTEVGAWCSKQIKTLQKAGDADPAEDAASRPEEPGPHTSVTEVLRKSII
ncbi:MAG: hypothetical protein M3461_17290 [Pseudomonadota bacterium]|nr:hypothetical protein [Pseudomonadota bacterium]